VKGVVCWDLDETLGWFRPVADELLERAQASGELGKAARIRQAAREVARRLVGKSSASKELFRLRPGIADALGRLREKGFVQVVTTGSFREYAHLALDLAGLRSHFVEVYARDAIWDSAAGGKRYAVVLERFGAKPEQLAIVGDDWKKDRSVEGEIVVVSEPNGLDKPAALVVTVVEALARESTLRAGFEALHAAAKPAGLGRRVELNGVRASIGYWGNYERGERTPVLSDLEAMTGRS
jgi:hypothetical protein